MAFTTDFVMGAGGGVEEIPVSMRGGGGSSNSPKVYPLTTVDAGAGAVIVVSGTMNPAAGGAEAYGPHLRIGSYTNTAPAPLLTGSMGGAIGAVLSGTVQISVLSRVGSATTFTGTVYVARL